MPGFLLEVTKNTLKMNFAKNMNPELLVESKVGGKYFIERRTIRKFLNDKVFFENEKYIILTEGVILNSKQLTSRYNKKSLAETIQEMYESGGETFFSEFRGSFSGLLYDKQKDVWLIYTNHFGDKWVFYSALSDRIIIASELPWIVDYMKNNHISYTFDEFGAYCLLTYGYMLEDHTLIKEIKRLLPGHYLRVKGGDVSILRYYRVDNKPDHLQTEEEIVQQVDELFKKAVELEFEKDKEYGYKHIASLSGGLDSRMTVWIAHELGYKEQLNLTFSQTNYLDETVPKKITADLRHEWLFKALDNGLYLKALEEALNISFGIVLYSGSAHGWSALKLIDFKDFGIYHTGQLGDVILGAYYEKEEENNQYKPGDGAYSRFLIEDSEREFLKLEYPNQEIFKFYNRGFNGILSGNLYPQRFTEVSSPFLNVDFFSYALKIPLRYRYDHRVYKKWILRKHPGAAEYLWEKIQGKITDRVYNIKGHKFTLGGLYRKAVSKILFGSSLNSKWNMNPLDYWYRTNPELKLYFERKFDELISAVPNRFLIFPDRKLQDVCMCLFTSGGVIEKTMVLTLLAAWRSYFEN